MAGLVPNLSRQPLKKLRPDPDAVMRLLLRWRDQATKAGGRIKRMVLAFEAGRDGFWLARWLRARGIEAYVIHPTSVARTPAGEDRPAGYRIIDAGGSRLAPWRAHAHVGATRIPCDRQAGSSEQASPRLTDKIEKK